MVIFSQYYYRKTNRLSFCSNSHGGGALGRPVFDVLRASHSEIGLGREGITFLCAALHAAYTAIERQLLR